MAMQVIGGKCQIFFLSGECEAKEVVSMHLLSLIIYMFNLSAPEILIRANCPYTAQMYSNKRQKAEIEKKQ